jgi:hypothetical protein
MAKLESMIGEFVDDLLIAIGEASIDELRGLLTQRPQGSGGALEQAAQRVRAAASAATSRPEPARGSRSRRVGTRRFLDPSLASGLTAPPGVADITDPESLLSFESVDVRESRPTPIRALPAALPAILAPPDGASRRERHVAPDSHESEGESPASGVRAVGGGLPIRLSDNETLARVSNAGVVIRRKKRA